MTRYYGVFASHHRLREPKPQRIGWAKLLARVFALDITR